MFISISDTGIGIPESFKEKLFHLDDTDNVTRTHGSGLGLMIV